MIFAGPCSEISGSAGDKMYQIILLIQILGIVTTLTEGWIIFKRWKGKLHSYLFFACVAMLVNNTGYLFELLARSRDGYISALFFSYFGRVWIVFTLLLFVFELTGTHVPSVILKILALYNLVTYVVVVTTQQTHLYYKSIYFFMNGKFPVLSHVNGIWHHIWMISLTVYIVFGIVFLSIARYREKNPVAQKRLNAVFLAILTQSVFFIVQSLKLLPVTYVYDITMLSYPIAALFMFIAIYRYNLLDTASLAREYVVDRLSEGIIAVDEEGRISYCNEPALTLFPELEKHPQKVLDMIGAAIESDEPVVINDRIYSPEANRLCCGTENAGTIYSITDDTEHFRYMEELEEQKRIADNANKAKSSFLANMSHEIRTPINAVLGMDEMIIRESGESQIRSYAKDIKTAGGTLLSLINDILDFSKIEEGRMEILPTQYELSSVVNDLVNMIRSRAEKKGLKLEVSVDPDVPHILYGDEIRIKQVALNILTNAVKYTNEGKVELDIGFDKISDDKIALKFRISDTGIGMKEEDMDKLFSPFSRIEEKRNRSVEGTGLGMSIVRQLLALMDSHLDVKSVYGEGSEFSFDIEQTVINPEPIGEVLARFGEDTDDTDEYHALFAAPSAHLLVVDDTEVNLAVFTNLLKQTKVDIDTAASGKAAISLAGSKDYDIVFIDHMMPDMDGIETLKRLKKEERVKTVYIALTANAVSGARQMYLDAGFSDYMSKPIDGRRLEELIQRYLPKEKIVPVTGEFAPAALTAVGGNHKVLVVDDDELTCALAEQILGPQFTVATCMDGRDAVSVAKKEMPDLILLDINLVGKNGFEVLEALKDDVTVKDIPVMFITVDEDREKEAIALKNGALDFVRKPFIPEVLIQRSWRIIDLNRLQKDLRGEVRQQTKRADRITKEMMVALSHTVDAKDHYTNGHSGRVAAYAAEIGRRMDKTPEEQKKLYEIGLLHDIGKIGIPEEIINKTERLTDEEFARIKEHTVIGCEILRGIKDMPELTDGARSHHERYDGSGYPDGLSGDAIPEVARIICVADCYDAMTSTRTYSDPKPQEVVRAEIERCSGKQFDPAIADIMLAMIDDDKDFIMNERKGGRDVWKGVGKYWDIDGPAAADKAMEAVQQQSALPKWIDEIPEIDKASAIANCGSADSFMSVLTVFHKTAKDKADEIEELYNKHDTENYTIKVHALKSSARIIGASKLSEMAKKLEDAGKSGDNDFIRDNTDALLERYRDLDSKLFVLDEKADGLPKLSGQMRDEAFRTIGEVAHSMDYGMMESVLKNIRGYELSDEDEETVKKIEERLMQLDFDAIEAIATQS